MPAYDQVYPLASIDAFKLSFPHQENALLVLNLGASHLEPKALTRVKSYIGQDHRIRLLLNTVDEHAMWTLLASSDTVLSLHRAEGFGLVPAQAMLLGKPVIATGWSDNMDFISDTTACLVKSRQVSAQDSSDLYVAPDLYWADPNIDQAAQFLRHLYNNPAEREALSKHARQGIEAYSRDSHAPIINSIRQWAKNGLHK